MHKRLYRHSNGRIGARMANLPVLLLDTIGRRSGTPRTNALTYLPWGDAFVVIASVLGEPKHPAWYHNLVARPEVRIQVGARRMAARARIAEGEERERIWDAVVKESPDYEQYRGKTERRIPVVVLEGVGA
ncbi:nitroreductase family deazaflavin-dependent oxidoreductase [Myxococcota bacterium]|nr:nitroreductase family deazaflavin-dependent oxidoreductase [Myxococcota bacterium]